jgi:hypothetical protein
MEKLKNRGDRSPWGTIQDVDYITPWLCSVSTSSHGGLKVSKAFNKLIPAYARRQAGWYEEDCEFSIVFVILEKQIKHSILESCDKCWKNILDNNSCLDTFRNCYPNEYESFFDVKLKEGESYVKDDNAWRERNKDNWVSFSASLVPKTSLCKVWFRIPSKPNISEISLLIEEKEYDKRGRWPMVLSAK